MLSTQISGRFRLKSLFMGWLADRPLSGFFFEDQFPAILLFS